MKNIAACFLALFLSMALVSCVGYENNIIDTEEFDSDHTNQNASGEKSETSGSEDAEKDEPSYLLPCLCDEGWGYMDSKGNVIIEGAYRGAKEFQGDYAVVQTGMKSVSLIDRTGKRLLAELEEKIGGLNHIEVMDDFALIRKDAYAAIVELPAGKVIVDNNEVFFIPGPVEGFYKVRKDGLSGYMNSHGQVVIEPVYIRVGEFRNNVALVETTEGKIRLIDTEGKAVLDDIMLDADKYEYAIELCRGDYIIVRDKTTLYYGIYQAGKGMILPAEYINMAFQSNGQFVAGNKQYEYSLFTPEGKEVESGYSNTKECGDGFYVVIDKSEKVKLMNQFGEEIYEFRSFRYPNNVYWDGKDTFFYLNSNKTIIVVDSGGKELAWITSHYNSEYSAEFTFVNGSIRMVDSELIYDSDGNISERKYHCEYFRYTGEKIEFNTEN
jgi:hypothetical protein